MLVRPVRLRWWGSHWGTRVGWGAQPACSRGTERPRQGQSHGLPGVAGTATNKCEFKRTVPAGTHLPSWGLWSLLHIKVTWGHPPLLATVPTIQGQGLNSSPVLLPHGFCSHAADTSRNCVPPDRPPAPLPGPSWQSVHVCTCACICVRVPECTHVCMHARVPCMYMHALPCLCMCEHMCTLLSVYMYTRVPQSASLRKGWKGPGSLTAGCPAGQGWAPLLIHCGQRSVAPRWPAHTSPLAPWFRGDHRVAHDQHFLSGITHRPVFHTLNKMASVLGCTNERGRWDSSPATEAGRGELRKMLRFVVDGLYPVPGISFPLKCRSREQGPVNTWKPASFPAPSAVERPAVPSARGHGDVTSKPLLATRPSL